MAKVKLQLPYELDGNSSYLVRVRSKNIFNVPSKWSSAIRVNTRMAGSDRTSRVSSTDDGLVAYDENGNIVMQYSANTDPRTNYVTNPSIEVNTTGWEPIDSNKMVITRYPDDFFVGYPGTSASLRVAASTRVTGPGVVTSVAARQAAGEGDVFTASAYVKVPDGQPEASVYAGVRYYDSGDVLLFELLSPSETLVTSTDGWVRVAVEDVTAPADTAKVALVVLNDSECVNGDFFIADAFLLEKTSRLKDYFDGSSSAGATTWSGTPNASTSVMTMDSPYYIDDAVITKAVFQTGRTVSTTGGVIIDKDGLRAYSPTGVLKVEIDAATGDITALDGIFTGSVFRTAINVGVGVPNAGAGVIFDGSGIRGYSGTGTTPVFSVDAITGAMTALSGSIAGWDINSTSLSKNNASISSTGVVTLGTSNDVVILSSADANYRIWVGNTTAASAPFSVTKAGSMTATAGSIAGWTISTNELYTGAGINKIAMSVSGAPKFYIGSGNFGSSDSPFYVDNTGKFSLGNQLIFNPANGADGVDDFADLMVAGKIRGALENVTLISSNKLQVSITGVNITSATAATITTATNAFLTNEYVAIEGLTGNASAANGVWQITVVNPTTFNIVGLVGATISNTTGIVDATASLREVTLGLHPSEGSGTYARTSGIGLRLDKYNWWMTNNQFRVGTSGSYFKWNGTRFEISGSGTKTLEMAVGAGDADNYYSIHNTGISPTFNNANTQFFVNAEGKLSLGTALTWDGSSLFVAGAISGGTIDIGGADATSFHVDSSGNMWLGAAAFNIATNPFAVASDGTLRAVSGTIGGWTLASTSLTGANMILSNAGDITAGTGNNVARVSASDGTYRIWAGHATPASAPFYVTAAGAVKATNADISGTITATSGTFTGTVNANAGNFSNNVTIGQHASKITLKGTAFDTTTSIYSGSGNYATADTPFYLDAAGRFSIREKMYFDSTQPTPILYIDGDIKAGNISGFVKLNNGGMKIGTNVDGANHDGIYIDASNYWYSTGVFSLGGASGIAYNGSAITIGTSTTFKGAVTIGSGANSFNVDTSGNIWSGEVAFNTGTNPFSVTNAGVLRATGVTITGTIQATTGYIGGSSGWDITTGKLSNSYTGGEVGLNAPAAPVSGDTAFYAGTVGTPEFKVTYGGALTATSANITQGGNLYMKSTTTANPAKIVFQYGGVNTFTVYAEDNSGTATLYLNGGLVQAPGGIIVGPYIGSRTYIDTSGNITATSISTFNEIESQYGGSDAAPKFKFSSLAGSGGNTSGMYYSVVDGLGFTVAGSYMLTLKSTGSYLNSKLNMNGNIIENIGSPTLSGHAVTKGYAESNFSASGHNHSGVYATTTHDHTNDTIKPAYITATSGNALALGANGTAGYLNVGTGGNITGSGTLGTGGVRWSTVYGTDGNFSGRITNAGVTSNLTSGSYQAVYCDTGTGLFGKNPSSIRYKENIQNLDVDSCYIIISKLNAVEFDYIADKNRVRKNFGFIAEDVADVVPELATYGPLSEDDDTIVPDGVRYELMSTVLYPVVKDLIEKVKDLEEKIKSLGG